MRSILLIACCIFFFVCGGVAYKYWNEYTDSVCQGIDCNGKSDCDANGVCNRCPKCTANKRKCCEK